MVVILVPTAPLTGNEQERVATPSICTVQAPHCAMPQPYLVPVRPSVSRKTQSKGVRGSAFACSDLPLTLSTAMADSRRALSGYGITVPPAVASVLCPLRHACVMRPSADACLEYAAVIATQKLGDF